MSNYIEIVKVNTIPFSSVIELEINFKTVVIDTEYINNSDVEITQKKLFITKARPQIYVDKKCTCEYNIPPKLIYIGGELPVEQPEQAIRYDLCIQELKKLLGAKWLKAYMCL